jgi:hypothetical protein
MLNNIVETMDDETTCLEHNNQDKTKDIAAETVKVVKHMKANEKQRDYKRVHYNFHPHQRGLNNDCNYKLKNKVVLLFLQTHHVCRISCLSTV